MTAPSALSASVAALVLLALAACGSEAPPAAAAAKSGAEVYRAQGCGLCHGTEGAGTSFGPTLHGKAPHWTRAALVEYLRAPVAYAEKDERLREQKKRYSMPMTQYDKVPQDELEAVADFVLSLP